MSRTQRDETAQSGPRRRSAPRARKRFGCELESGGKRGRGIVLNLSQSGLYVQTMFSPPDLEIAVRILDPYAATAIPLFTLVARWYLPEPRLRSVIRPGLGLRITSAPAPYLALLASLKTDEPRD